jgi:hypothetical protein
VNARYLRIVAAAVSAIVLTAATVAGQSSSEHESHHPAGTAAAPSPAPPSAASGASVDSAPTSPAQSSPGMGGMAGEMMRAMHGAPSSAPLVARALNSSRLSEAERAQLLADADRQVVRAQAQFRHASRELDAALAAGDEPKADRARDEIREAVSDIETGRAVRAAVVAAPAETEARALAWFKRELRITDEASVIARREASRRWLLVAALAAVSMAGGALYLYKVGRAVRWLTRVARPE